MLRLLKFDVRLTQYVFCPCLVILCPDLKNQKKKNLQFSDSQNVSASVINGVFLSGSSHQIHSTD